MTEQPLTNPSELQSLTPANSLPVNVQLRQAREARGLSQEKVAVLAGLRVKHYQRIETGYVLPRLGTLTAAAAVVGLRVALVEINQEES